MQTTVPALLGEYVAMSNTKFTVELAALIPLVDDHFAHEFERAVAAAREADATRPTLDVGLNEGSMGRATIYFRQHISSGSAEIEKDAHWAFTLSWALGEREAYRRMMVALSTPSAKGREVEVLQALMNGSGIIEALAGRRPKERALAESNVIALRRER